MINPVDGDIVDFHLVQDGIFGNDRKGVKILSGAMNYAAARIIDNQLALKHSALYPYFKEKVSNNDNPALYQYLVYENANGVPEVVGIPWILESTYKSIKGRVMVITIQNWSEAERENYVTFLSNMGATYIMTEKDKHIEDKTIRHYGEEALREEAEAGRKDEEWLRYQVEELAAAHLKEGEQTELEQELEVLSNADRISETLTALRNALDDEQIGVLVQLKASETACRHLEAGYPFAAEAAGRLRSVLEELKDLGASAAAQSERLDADPERLQKIGDRLNTIYSLCQKHRAADLGELLAKQTDYEARLQAITHGDEAIAAVATELTATEEKAEELARNIHATREKAAPTFNDAIQTTLARLGMPEARFVVQLTPAPALTPTGDDEIDFLFTANGNFAPQKVERIASGGEISRVMLALKALLAHRMELPTIIFDEIDTGVSGRIADAMGEIIADLSQTMQVVDITHLPQVASKGDTHFVVYKDAEGSHIRRLDPEERITEIAKMLSGSQITEAALAQARILLDK